MVVPSTLVTGLLCCFCVSVCGASTVSALATVTSTGSHAQPPDATTGSFKHSSPHTDLDLVRGLAGVSTLGWVAVGGLVSAVVCVVLYQLHRRAVSAQSHVMTGEEIRLLRDEPSQPV